MADAIGAFIERFIAHQLAPPITGEINHDVYEKRLGKKNYKYMPRCIYFYYVRMDRDGKLRVDHYFYVKGKYDDPVNPTHPETWKQIKPHEIPCIIQELAMNARPGKGKKKDPPKLPDEQNFNRIKWKRKSYIAIFVDEANWVLHKSAKLPAVVFNTDNPTKDPVKENERGKRICENHTFFDADDLDIKMPVRDKDGNIVGSDTRTAVYFINHMKKNDAGDDLEAGDPDEFKFNIFFDVKFAEGYDAPMTVIFDPGSENQGPPLKP